MYCKLLLYPLFDQHNISNKKYENSFYKSANSVGNINISESLQKKKIPGRRNGSPGSYLDIRVKQ